MRAWPAKRRIPAWIVAAALVAALASAVVVSGSSTLAANPVPEKTTLPDVEDEVMCPVCGTALNLSDSPQADRERAFIRRLIDADKTKEEIKDELVAQYGTEVLAEPPKSGFDLTAWLIPGLAILAAAIAIAFGLVRWRRAGRRREASEGPAGSIDHTERERLDSDLARYDL